jgi:phosphoglycolate phosphatase
MSYYFEKNMFTVIAGQKDHIPHKPAPDGVFLITDELKVKPEDCLFVGDTSVDMKTAKAAGMKAIGVSWGFRPVEELQESGADSIIYNPLELFSLL